jgi:hypothetical protein
VQSAHAQSGFLFLWKWKEGGGELRLKYVVTFRYIITSELCVLLIAEFIQNCNPTREILSVNDVRVLSLPCTLYRCMFCL